MRGVATFNARSDTSLRSRCFETASGSVIHGEVTGPRRGVSALCHLTLREERERRWTIILAGSTLEPC
jgi:hypothetical protein